jgi:phosphomannomutase
VTKEGNNIFPDRQMMLFARDVLSRVPGGTILFDVKCTQRLAPAIKQALVACR